MTWKNSISPFILSIYCSQTSLSGTNANKRLVLDFQIHLSDKSHAYFFFVMV